MRQLPTIRFTRRRALVGTALAATTVALGAGLPGGATAQGGREHGQKPTVLLVHGAFADASSWHEVIRLLTIRGYDVLAPANPLRDLAGDAAYVASIATAVSGPVLLVGHSYGGAVITNAASQAPNVVGLVYVAGFGLDTNESLAGVSERFPKTLLADAVRPQPFPTPDGATGTDIYVDRAAFPSVFAQDVPRDTAALMAVTQRPMTESAFTAPSGEPAWRTLPSWYLVARQDNALHPEAQRFFAQRMAAKKIAEVDSSHAAMVSQPDAVARLIQNAARGS